jgi:serine-type D-Ala-D-Ala carboxypeptidase/endopeptidase
MRGDERAVAARGVAPDAVVELGSITKVVTAVALADMAEEGLIGLDDPLSAQLAAAAALRVGAADARSPSPTSPATPRVCRAGRRACFRRAPLRRDDPWGSISASGLEESLARVRPRRAPGGAARYSNLGAALLGMALCRRAGSGYEDLVRSRVLAPLGMDETGVHPPAALLPRVAQGHSPPRPAGAALDDGRDRGGGSAHGHRGRPSAPRPRRRAAARLAPGTGDRPEPGAAGANGTGAPGRPRLDDLAAAGRAPAVWHNGGTGGFRTIVAVVPDRATGAVALATSARPPDGAAMWLLERLTEAAAPAS